MFVVVGDVLYFVGWVFAVLVCWRGAICSCRWLCWRLVWLCRLIVGDCSFLVRCI